MNPTIFNSKSKIGAILFAVVVLLQMWLPTMGVELSGTDWEKVFSSLEVVSVVLAAFGIRDAIFKTQNEIQQQNLNEQK